MVFARLRLVHRVELNLEPRLSCPNANYKPVDELDAVLATLVSRFAAKLGRRDSRLAGEAVHATRLPVAWVTGIDDHDSMQIAAEPQRRRQTRRTPANYRYVIRFVHDRQRRQTWCQRRAS